MLELPRPYATPKKPILLSIVGVFLFLLSAGTSRAEDQKTIIQKIDEEVHSINFTLGQGTAVQLQPQCGYGRCLFTIAFRDQQGHIRKIIFWAEGTKGPPPNYPLPMRAISDLYFDTTGEPIFAAVTYQGEPTSGWTRQDRTYMHNGSVIYAKEAQGELAEPFHDATKPDDHSVSAARHEFQNVSKRLEAPAPAHTN